jgi:hypothetical protein
MISELTYKVVALSEVIQLDPNECVDWAIEMLEFGYETPNLLMLAGCDKSASYFEIKPYLENAAKELGLQMKIGDDAVISYSYYFIREISLGKKVRSNLAELNNFCQQRDYEGIVYDFYLLFWAWDQIDYDDTNQNHYWEGTNKENIESTVVKIANDWLKENKEHYIQQGVKMH